MKKIIALVLSAIMLLSSLPFGVLAEEASEKAAPVLSDVKAEATSGKSNEKRIEPNNGSILFYADVRSKLTKPF